MYVTLALALLLLVVMAWLILRPFLSAAPAGAGTAPPVVVPPRDLGAARTTAAAVAATAVAEAAAAAPAPAAAAAAPAAKPSVDELRASVEAAVAARKAAMVRHSCPGCDAPIETGDVFCRACGTRVKEA